MEATSNDGRSLAGTGACLSAATGPHRDAARNAPSATRLRSRLRMTTYTAVQRRGMHAPRFTRVPAAIAEAVRAAGPAEPDAARQRASRTVALQCAATSIPYPERTVQSPGQSTGPPGPTSYTPLRNVSTESARVWWEAAIPG